VPMVLEMDTIIALHGTLFLGATNRWIHSSTLQTEKG
jgi:hypothetical protein